MYTAIGVLGILHMKINEDYEAANAGYAKNPSDFLDGKCNALYSTLYTIEMMQKEVRISEKIHGTYRKQLELVDELEEVG